MTVFVEATNICIDEVGPFVAHEFRVVGAVNGGVEAAIGR